MAIEPADLFSANQIIHLRPITGHDVFRRFVEANPFVQRVLSEFHGRRDPGGGLHAIEDTDRDAVVDWRSRRSVNGSPARLRHGTS